MFLDKFAIIESENGVSFLNLKDRLGSFILLSL